jgi:hypothetical protein
MDVKCPGCFTITTVFSHAQTVVVCAVLPRAALSAESKLLATMMDLEEW